MKRCNWGERHNVMRVVLSVSAKGEYPQHARDAAARTCQPHELVILPVDSMSDQLPQ